MQTIMTNLEGVRIIEPDVIGDSRGWFSESYSSDKYVNSGIETTFVQDNHSFSAQKGILRGLHFQIEPKPQAKLVRCTRGTILDVVVDLREGSPTFKQWISIELSEKNKKQIFIPKGFAHGFLTLTDDVEVQYKVDEYYSAKHDRSIRFDDPELKISWGIKNPILSDKDLNAPTLKESDANFSYKYLVTGGNGQLGHEVVKQLKNRNCNVLAPSSKDFNLLNPKQIEAYLYSERPDVIIHCAAYTAVDRAEDEKNICYEVNVKGTESIVDVAKKINAKLVYISSDYVFDGQGDTPYQKNDNTNPINFYGVTKEIGEKIVQEQLSKYFIIRTAWVYGISGDNFVKTMLNLAKNNKNINVVDDQIGSPTYASDLAEYIVNIVKTNHYGIYHGVNTGYCSKYEFAKSIFNKYGLSTEVSPILSNEYPTKAKRPLNSRLVHTKIELANEYSMPEWEDGLTRFIKELKDQEDLIN